MDEYVLPTFATVLHSSGNWFQQCSMCGAVVSNPDIHTDWHSQLWVALSRER